MSLAVIGAGLSGLAAAYVLRDAPLDVTLFEKSRGVSGRAATRHRDGVSYDHGANHFKTKTERLQSLVQEGISSDDLVKIKGSVHVFGADGDVTAGDPEKNREVKWTYRDGVSRLGKHLAEAAGADLKRKTHITLLTRAGGEWVLTDTEGREHGAFEAVLLTPPAPQAADLLKASRFDDGVREGLVEALAPATYRTQLTLVLAYRERIERPDGCYALLNHDGAHEIAWLGFEEEKPGHVPAKGPVASVLVAQMSPAWSRPRFRSELRALAAEVTALAGSLLRQDLSRPLWTDKQGWRYALPEASADPDALAAGAQVGLFFAGDALQGTGRIGKAVESGLDAGERVRRYFEETKGGGAEGGV